MFSENVIGKWLKKSPCCKAKFQDFLSDFQTLWKGEELMTLIIEVCRTQANIAT